MKSKIQHAKKHANGYWQAYAGTPLITGDFHRLKRDAVAFAKHYAQTGQFDAKRFNGFSP